MQFLCMTAPHGPPPSAHGTALIPPLPDPSPPQRVVAAAEDILCEVQQACALADAPAGQHKHLVEHVRVAIVQADAGLEWGGGADDSAHKVRRGVHEEHVCSSQPQALLQFK